MTPRCRLTVHLPHRELWLWRCAVLRALGLTEALGVPRVWNAPNVAVTDTRTVVAVVWGEPEQLEADVRYALWLTLAPCHRGLVQLVRVEIDVERSEEARPAPLTRIPPIITEGAA